ncbi:hypothetical protein BJ508DRAFT_322002 [Ascobolus immersus RN42]|uniref:BTB domain-containing protein n=1 Tax=Ascobolus immersus RN42 TaxID=1160509 RepID=A0A3N4IJM0_ASCIM|nr:hypothetical protein BJ508DRAFT_322002 [Ascobolus immersus RN42]
MSTAIIHIVTVTTVLLLPVIVIAVTAAYYLLDCTNDYDLQLFSELYAARLLNTNPCLNLTIGIFRLMDKSKVLESKVYLIDKDQLVAKSEYFRALFRFPGKEKTDNTFILDISRDKHLQKVNSAYHYDIREEKTILICDAFVRSFYELEASETRIFKYTTAVSFKDTSADSLERIMLELHVNLQYYILGHRTLTPSFMELALSRMANQVGVLISGPPRQRAKSDLLASFSILRDDLRMLYESTSDGCKSRDGMRIVYGVVFAMIMQFKELQSQWKKVLLEFKADHSEFSEHLEYGHTVLNKKGLDSGFRARVLEHVKVNFSVKK